MTDPQQHQQQPHKPPLQSQESRPPQELQEPQSQQGYPPPEPQQYQPPEPEQYQPPERERYQPPEREQYRASEPEQYQPPERQQYQPSEEARQDQLREEARPYEPPKEARREEPSPQPAKSIQELLNQNRTMLEGEPETEATKQFAKDLDDMAKEYDGITAIVAKYQAAHETFLDPMMPTAKVQRDEVQSWCDDEVSQDVKDAIEALRHGYDKRERDVVTARNDARGAFNAVKSKLDQAKAAEAEALAEFTKAKGFEAQAQGWFTDVANLHKNAKGHRDARNYPLVYAHFLEIEDIWTNKLVRNFGDDGIATPQWLLRKLNEKLRALILAKRGRFEAHKDWLAKEKAAASAAATYKAFVEDGGRRKEFLREAQDVEPGQPGSSPSRSEPAPQTRQQTVPEPGPYRSEPASEQQAVTSAAA